MDRGRGRGRAIKKRASLPPQPHTHTHTHYPSHLHPAASAIPAAQSNLPCSSLLRTAAEPVGPSTPSTFLPSSHASRGGKLGPGGSHSTHRPRSFSPPNSGDGLGDTLKKTHRSKQPGGVDDASVAAMPGGSTRKRAR